MSVNKVILVGRLGQNPEIRYTTSGAAVVNFSLATNESWIDKTNGQKQERTEWHKIVVWGKLGELCNQFLSKGRQAYVEGRIQTRQWQDKDGQTKYMTEIVAQTVHFIGGVGMGVQKENSNADAPNPSSSSGFSSGPGTGFGNYGNQPTTPPGFGNNEMGSAGGNGSGGGGGPVTPMPTSSFTEDDVPF